MMYSLTLETFRLLPMRQFSPIYASFLSKNTVNLMNHIQQCWHVSVIISNIQKTGTKDSKKNMPSTNNGLESTNAQIKKSHTFGERMPMNLFLSCMLKMVEEWSIKRNPTDNNFIEFAETPAIDLSTWTEGFHMSIIDKDVLRKVILFYVDLICCCMIF